VKIIILILLFSNIALAKCYVTSETDQKGNNVIRCVEGFVPKTVLQDAPIDTDTGKPLKYGQFLKKELIPNDDPVFETEFEYITIYKFDPDKKAEAFEKAVAAKKKREDDIKAQNARLIRIKTLCPTMPPDFKDICDHMTEDL